MKLSSPSEGGASLPIVKPAIFSRFPIVNCGLSTRMGGVSPQPYGMNLSFNVGDAKEHVMENRNRFFTALRIPENRIAIPRQRHTATIRTVDGPGTYEDCDALITNTRDVFLSVSVADCAPVFLFEQEHEVVACVHAGWRGSELRILQKTVMSLQEQFGSNPRDIVAFIGPSAGPCCYEVGEEVAVRFDNDQLSRRDGKVYLDIKRANMDQLRLAGIPDSNIEIHGDCTICKKDLYHSFRRDRDKSGRMIGVIGMIQ